MAGFVLGNTLSDNGTVTRGVCKADENNLLIDIVETKGIEKKGDTAVALNNAGEQITLSLEGAVSMNMWGFTPVLLGKLEEEFITFLEKEGRELKSEYLLPEVVGTLIKKGEASVEVLKTADKWFGVTYKEDKPVVVASFNELIKQGQYPEKLF